MMDDYIRRQRIPYRKMWEYDETGTGVAVMAITQEEVDALPPADVVSRDCFDRILLENDTMRQQLAEIGKTLGAKMDDVRRVVRGRWVLDSDPGEPWRYVCDQCGEITTDTCMGEPRAAFCPMCGAEMNGGDAT